MKTLTIQWYILLYIAMRHPTNGGNGNRIKIDYFWLQALYFFRAYSFMTWLLTFLFHIIWRFYCRSTYFFCVHEMFVLSQCHWTHIHSHKLSTVLLNYVKYQAIERSICSKCNRLKVYTGKKKRERERMKERERKWWKTNRTKWTRNITCTNEVLVLNLEILMYAYVCMSVYVRVCVFRTHKL